MLNSVYLTRIWISIGLCSIMSAPSQSGHAFVNIKQNILGPPLIDRPFVVAWQVPSEKCLEDYGIQLNLANFDIVYNPGKSWSGDTLVIFYQRNIGLVPYYDKKGNSVNGGLPQLADLTAHLYKAVTDIELLIPDPEFRGLAVIDWESWVARFERVGVLYQKKSIEKVKREHPDWTDKQQVAQARSEYNSATETLMRSTLALGKMFRPKAYWGFYLYPNCNNQDQTGKDLSCSNITIHLNDKIEWLFDDSTSVYPSVYFPESFKDKSFSAKYVANRVREAMRVDAARSDKTSIPVFPYHMISYKREAKFLDVNDLQHSISVSAVLGSSGIVMWGGYNVANSLETCLKLSEYVNKTLGPFCKKTSDTAAKCSTKNCNGHGRCVIGSRLRPAQEEGQGAHFPTVHEALDLVKSVSNKGYKLYDERMGKNTKVFKNYVVQCQCYSGWKGDNCSIPKL